MHIILAVSSSSVRFFSGRLPERVPHGSLVFFIEVVPVDRLNPRHQPARESQSRYSQPTLPCQQPLPRRVRHSHSTR